MSDVAIEVPTPDGTRPLWFGDIVSGEKDIGNFYRITPVNGAPILLRMDSLEDVAALEQQLPLALDAWRREYRDVLAGLPEPTSSYVAERQKQERAAMDRQRREEAQWNLERKKYESSSYHRDKSIIVAPAPVQPVLTGGRSW
jgi:hypothetical protein